MGKIFLPETKPRTRDKRGGFVTEDAFSTKIAGITAGFDPLTNDIEVTSTGNYNLFTPKYAIGDSGAADRGAGDAVMILEVKARVLTAFTAGVTLSINGPGGALIDSVYLAPQSNSNTGSLKSSHEATSPIGGVFMGSDTDDIYLNVGVTPVLVGKIAIWVVYAEVRQDIR